MVKDEQGELRAVWLRESVHASLVKFFISCKMTHPRWEPALVVCDICAIAFSLDLSLVPVCF